MKRFSSGILFALVACGSQGLVPLTDDTDAAVPVKDGGVADGGSGDGGSPDGGIQSDAGTDVGTADGSSSDSGIGDGGRDGGVIDSGVGDGGVIDGGISDGGSIDGGEWGTWYTTCPPPVCGGTDRDAGIPGLAHCTEEKKGQPCTPLGRECDPQLGCRIALRCATQDPGRMCPISRRRFKEDIRYLSVDEIDAIQKQMLRLPLIDAAQNGIDPYAYSTMAVAATQAQARELESLRREIKTLRREVERKRR